MKRNLAILLSAAALGLWPHGLVQALAQAADPANAAVAASEPEALDPVGTLVDKLQLTTYAKRDSIPSAFDRMNQQIDSQIAAWKAAGRRFSPQTSEQLRVARNSAAEKINALALATPETWTTVKANALVTLENVRGALHALDVYSSK
jgi:hypothetical protein